MNRQRYPTDLTDAQWAVLAPLIPPAKPGGRPRAMAMREIVNAILYVTRTGIPWEERPHDFPKWQTVSAYHRLWLDEGVWEAINDARRRPAAAEGFEVLPTRWIVECTFGWLGWYRRLSKDYEVLTGVAAAFIYAAMIHLMLRRLAA